MKKSELTCEILQHALRIYAEEAYGSNVPENRKDVFNACGKTPEELLTKFDDESAELAHGVHERYVLRLGNVAYPCMKLVFEEMLFDNEFVFVVDSHDEIELDETFPDYRAWQSLRQRNKLIKDRIERRLMREGLPTAEVALRHAKIDAERSHPIATGKKVMVVIKTMSKAEALVYALTAHGYEAASAPHSGEHIDYDKTMLDVMMENFDAVIIGKYLGQHLPQDFIDDIHAHFAGAPDRAPKIILGRAALDRRLKHEGVDAVAIDPFEIEDVVAILEGLFES